MNNPHASLESWNACLMYVLSCAVLATLSVANAQQPSATTPVFTLGNGSGDPITLTFAEIKRGYKIRVYTGITSDAAKKIEVSTLIARMKLAQGFDKGVLRRMGIRCSNDYYKDPKVYLCDLGRLGPLEVSSNGNAFVIQLDPNAIGGPPAEDVPLEVYAKSYNNLSKEAYPVGPVKITIKKEAQVNRSSLEAKHIRIYKVSFFGLNLDRLLGFQGLRWWVDGADTRIPMVTHPGLGTGQNTFSLVRNDQNPGQVSGTLTDQSRTISIQFDDNNALVSGEYSGTLKGIRSALGDDKDLRLIVRVSSAPIIPALLLAAGLLGGFFFRRYLGIITQTEGLLIRIHSTINRFLGQPDNPGQPPGERRQRDPFETALLAKARSLERAISDFRSSTPITVDPTSAPFVALKAEVSAFELLPTTGLELLAGIAALEQQQATFEINLRHAQSQLASASALAPRAPEVLATIQRLLDETAATQRGDDIAKASANGDWRLAGRLADQHLLESKNRALDARRLAQDIPDLEAWADRAVSLNSGLVALAAQTTAPTVRVKRLTALTTTYLGRAGDALFNRAIPDKATLEKVLTRAAASLEQLEVEIQGRSTLPPFQTIPAQAAVPTTTVTRQRFVWHGLLGLTLQNLAWFLLLFLSLGVVFALSIRLTGPQAEFNFTLVLLASVISVLIPFGLVRSAWRLYMLRRKVFGTWIFSMFSLRDVLVLVIPFLPLLVVGFNDFAGTKSTFGMLTDDLAALTWGIGSQTAVQALFTFVERLPLARSLFVQT
jgi:hypothetical protein